MNASSIRTVSSIQDATTSEYELKVKNSRACLESKHSKTVGWQYYTKADDRGEVGILARQSARSRSNNMYKGE